MTLFTSAAASPENQGDVRLNLSGAFDAAGATAWRPAIEGLAACKARRVVLDFTDVDTIDGSGVGAISFLFKRLIASGRKLVVTGVAGQPLAILTELGLARILGLDTPTARSAHSLKSWFGGLAIAGGH